MYIRNVSAHARAKAGVQVRSAVYAQELQEFLCNQSCEFLSQKIPFRLKEEQAGDGEHDFIYVGSHTITRLRFELLGKRYEAAGFGDPLLAFIRPAIFDDLFADELAMLNDMGSDGKINGAEAFKFFNRYAAQPALDASLKKLAKQGEIELDIRRIYDETTSKYFTENPFKVKYKFQSVNSDIGDISIDELYKILKEALTEYGNRGIDGRENLPKEHEVVTFLHD